MEDLAKKRIERKLFELIVLLDESVRDARSDYIRGKISKDEFRKISDMEQAVHEIRRRYT